MMANKGFKTLKVRRDPATTWDEKDPVLQDGEPGASFRFMDGHMCCELIKIGNGVTPWSELRRVGQVTFQVTAPPANTVGQDGDWAIDLTHGLIYGRKTNGAWPAGVPFQTVGSVGPQGAKGDKGDRGDVGPKGDTGPSGTQGQKGDTGTTGAAGTPAPTNLGGTYAVAIGPVVLGINATLGTVAIPGAAVGENVVVETTDTNLLNALSSLRGVVLSAGVVTIRGQGISLLAAGTRNLIITVIKRGS